jgi:pilus assembly protein Flp/PilA
MKTITKTVRRFLASDAGPTAVEYAVMLALVIIVCVAAIAAVGTHTSGVFNDATQSLPS